MWNKDIEALDREDLEHIQLEGLQMTINRAMDKVAFYRQRLLGLGFEPGDVRSLEDLRRLPLTTKADLLEYSPYGLLAVPLGDVVRFHTSSGVGGRNCIVAYTKGDLAAWRQLMARVMAAAGVTPQDIVQVAFAYGLATGGAAFQLGAETIGASVVPAGQAALGLQIDILREFRSTVLACTPTWAMELAEAIESRHMNPETLDLKRGLFGAEPWSENLRRRIESFFGLTSFDVYGLAELIGPGLAGECAEHRGLHLAEDMFLAEVVDPASGQLLPPGREGELVLTTLVREAQPLIRYRTGDLTTLDHGPCPCGRTHLRMARVARRTDDIIIHQGVSILPGTVARILANLGRVQPQYQLRLAPDRTPARLELTVRLAPEPGPRDEAARRTLAETIAREFRLATGAEIFVIIEE